MSPVFYLDDELIFPHPVLHEPEGLLAAGSTLSAKKLLLAYRWGIFPWYHEDQPVLWWWLTPRLMLRPSEVHISRSMKKIMRQGHYSFSIDKNFRGVMEACATVQRKGQDGTWILPEMIDAYSELFNLGYAHSFEAYDEEGLAGGVYGVVLGKIFFGESMFSLRPNASKAAFIFLANYLHQNDFRWIDCQQDTPHMRSLGAYLIEEDDFLEILRENQLAMLRTNNLNLSSG